MAMELIIYGCIEGTPHYGDKANFRLLQRRNRKRLKALPVCMKDEPGWESKPVITRSFFAISGRDEMFLSQIIHFGGSYRCFSDDYWQEWLGEFENILRGMYWFGVDLKVSGEVPNASYFWVPTDAAQSAMFDAGRPVTDWEFGGGSRESLWENGKPSSGVE